MIITQCHSLGVGAGFLWTAQGAIVMSYPEEKNKGLYISIFWGIFNCGAIIGSIVSLGIEWHNEVSHVSDRTYIAFMVIMGVGCALTLLLLPPTQIQRADGSQVAKVHAVRVSTEAMAILKLFQDWRMLCLIPMFFSSNWFYTYQFNAVNGGGMFTTRTRGMNGTLYWVAQVLGSFLMGRLLDYKHAERKRRAICGLGVLLVATMVIWGGGYAFQETFSRSSVKSLTVSDKIDLADSRRYGGPVVLYSLYGLFDAIWQTYCYWIMGALSNQTDVAARMAGFYKAIQNAGAACAGQVDAKKVSYEWELLINWILLMVGTLFAIPVALSLQNSLQASAPEEATTVKELEDTGGDPAQVET
jgi:MFS family permease